MKNYSILAAAIALTSSDVYADSAADSVEKMLVTATRFEGPALPVATNITVVDREQIRLSGASQLSEVLKQQAGIQIQDLDGSGGRNVSVAMRGFAVNAANNTLILVDGRRLNNPTLASPSLNGVSLNDVERIEIVHGSAGVLYGDQAVAGVINIITKRATSDQVNAAVETSFGSDNLETYKGSVSQAFSNGVSYRLSAESKNADNYRDNNQQSYENYFLNLGYKFERGSVFVETQKIDDDLRLAGSLTQEEFRDDPTQTGSPFAFSDSDVDLIRLGGDVALTESTKLVMEYSWRDDERVGISSFGTASEQATKVETFSPRIVSSFPTWTGEAILTAGFDYIDSDYQRQSGGNPANNATQEVSAYYAHIIAPLSDSVSLNVGGRRSEVNDDNELSGLSQKDDLEAYEVGITYQLQDNIRLFARYADAFRYANIDENNRVLAGVDFLKPQTSESIEAGVEFSYESFDARIQWYDMELEDEIIYDRFDGANINMPQSERQGVTIDAGYEFSEKLRLKASYTYTDAEVVEGVDSGNEVPFVSENMATVSVVYSPVNSLSLFLGAEYSGSRYKVGDEENSQPRLDSYTLLNANVNFDMGHWQANLAVKNITNEDYAGYHGTYAAPWLGADVYVDYIYPQPERTVEARVRYQF